MDVFKGSGVTESDLQFHGVFAPGGSLQPLHQTVAAPIVVGSSFLSPELERLGESRRGGEHGGTKGDPSMSHTPTGSY